MQDAFSTSYTILGIYIHTSTEVGGKVSAMFISAAELALLTTSIPETLNPYIQVNMHHTRVVY